jgi:hypothetical protein
MSWLIVLKMAISVWQEMIIALAQNGSKILHVTGIL